MRRSPAAAVTAGWLLLILAGPAAADGGGSEDVANPLAKSLLLFPDSSGALSLEASRGRTAVPASTPAAPGVTEWTIQATKNSRIDSSVFLELHVLAEQPSVVLGGPEGASFLVELTHNGQPVEGAASLQQTSGALIAPGQFRFRLFFPQPDILLAPGDAFGLRVTYFGTVAEAQPALYYVLGPELTRMQFKIRLASLAELRIPSEVGPWPVALVEGFDFEAAAKKNPDAKVFTLRAFQFGYRGAPIVVPNGTKVILQLLVDESLSTAGEGHGGGHHAGGAGATEAGPGAWDEPAPLTPLHGFSLAGLDPRLHTVLPDGLVVTMPFVADKPGNYTFLCTVVCGSGHAGMMDRMTIEDPPEPQALAPTELGPAKPIPGVSAVALLAIVASAAVLRLRRA